MKTITEYAPLIFTRLSDHTRHRREVRQRLRRSSLLIGSYSVVGLALSTDTGFLPWDWQFWMMFLPFFVAGEAAFRLWLKRRQDLLLA